MTDNNNDDDGKSMAEQWQEGMSQLKNSNHTSGVSSTSSSSRAVECLKRYAENKSRTSYVEQIDAHKLSELSDVERRNLFLIANELDKKVESVTKEDIKEFIGNDVSSNVDQMGVKKLIARTYDEEEVDKISIAMEDDKGVDSSKERCPNCHELFSADNKGVVEGDNDELYCSIECLNGV